MTIQATNECVTSSSCIDAATHSKIQLVSSLFSNGAYFLHIGAQTMNEVDELIKKKLHLCTLGAYFLNSF
jgi:hypothetical protein